MRLHLLSDSCTTGWAHWGHGELWLTPDAIVRIGKRSLTVAAAQRGASVGSFGGAAGALLREIAHARGVDRVLEVEPPQWRDHLNAHANVLSVELADVTNASLRSGFMTSRLSLRLRNNRTVKLLWTRNANAVGVLEQVLGSAR